MRNRIRNLGTQLTLLGIQLTLLAICVAPAWAQTDDWRGRHGSSGVAAGRPPGPPHGYGPPPGRSGGWGYRPPPGPAYGPGFAGGYRPYPGPDSWRAGAWRRDWHEGRFGWWWTVGPSWYAFETPVYPYPAYAAPVEIVPPPTILVQPPPRIVVQPPPPGPAPAQFWYWCQDPRGYFPYVPSCNGNWQEVSANPTR